MYQADGRVTIADAQQANDDGDFETCLAMCDAVPARDAAIEVEITLLRARVHVRLDRGDRALEALRKSAFASLTVDQYVTAHMLTGAAYVRLGQNERGDAILTETLGRAQAASPMVRAELALHLGIAKFRLAKYDAADQLFASIPAEADIVHAHALEYRGWVAQALGHFEAAAQFFREALAMLAACRRRDRYVEAKSLYGLTALCPELLLTHEWQMVERRLKRFDWSVSGVARWRFWVSLAASMMCETTGDVGGARRWARRAYRSAEGEGYRVAALCRLAAVFRGLKEVNAHADLIEWARETYDVLDVRDLTADLRQLPLYLAEEVAYTSVPGDADELLAQYREIVLPALKVSSSGLERYVAMERSVEAALLEARGEKDGAVRAFADSYDLLSKFGHRRGATLAALHLARLTGEESYFSYAEAALREASPLFWMARELAEIRSGPGPSVTATEMGILRLLVQGKTYKEIASVRRASIKTVGNHVQALFRKFRVHSRGELAAETIRRGIVSLHDSPQTTNG